MKHKSWLFIIVGLLLLATVALFAFRRGPEPSAGETPPTPTLLPATRTPTITATPPGMADTPSLLALIAAEDWPTVTPLATGEPTVPPEAMAMRAAPTATPGNPPPAPTATPTVTPYPTPQPVSVGGVDAVEMVEIPAGEFLMGISYEEAMRRNSEWRQVHTRGPFRDYTNEAPQLRVYLETFSIDQVEVTNTRYRRCVDAGVCPEAYLFYDMPDYTTAPRYAEYPALNVPWEGAHAYCQWVGKRLPTESEWEKAARGTDGRVYPWGNESAPENSVALAQLQAVGSLPAGASPYGVLDMVGNAPEWTADRYQAYPRLSNPEPAGDANTPYVIRGVNTRYYELWVTQRIFTKDISLDAVGFRCVQGGAPVALAESVVQILEPDYALTPTTTVDLNTMVYIPAGEFLMGGDVITDANGMLNYSSDQPQYVVYLDAFYIDAYPVTYGQYADFLNVLGAHRQACNGEDCIAYDFSDFVYTDGQYNVVEGYGNYAADHINWAGANAYCTWQGKRLPTEAEWEKAARGTDGRRYPWGNAWDKRSQEDDHSFEHEIGQEPFNRSPYGVHDMLGHNGEWVNDWYAADYYTYSPYANPQGPSSGNGHVFRGGAGRSAIWGITSRAGSGSGSFRCAYTLQIGQNRE